MSRYRCDCGDTECPSCGSAQGTYFPPDTGTPPDTCEICGEARSIDEDGGTLYYCARCVKDIKRAIQFEPRS